MIIMGVMVGERGSEGIDNDPEQHFAVMPRMRGLGQWKVNLKWLRKTR